MRIGFARFGRRSFRLHILQMMLILTASTTSRVALAANDPFVRQSKEVDPVVADCRSLSAARAGDEELKGLLIGDPRRWLSNVGFNSLRVRFQIQRTDWDPEFSEGPFTPSRIFFSILYEYATRTEKIAVLVYERNDQTWHSHVAGEGPVVKRRGLGTFIYLMSGYVLAKYLEIKPVSAPYAPPDDDPRSADATALWNRLVRFGLARASEGDDGLSFRFKFDEPA